MTIKLTIKAIAIAIPLSLGATLPALAEHGQDRWNQDSMSGDQYRGNQSTNYGDQNRWYGDQQRHHRHRQLSFYRIEQRLEGRGYYDIEQIGFYNGLYRVRAHDHQGRHVRLLVSASNGQIIRQRYADSSRRSWSDRSHGWN